MRKQFFSSTHTFSRRCSSPAPRATFKLSDAKLRSVISETSMSVVKQRNKVSMNRIMQVRELPLRQSGTTITILLGCSFKALANPISKSAASEASTKISEIEIQLSRNPCHLKISKRKLCFFTSRLISITSNLISTFSRSKSVSRS